MCLRPFSFCDSLYGEWDRWSVPFRGFKTLYTSGWHQPTLMRFSLTG